MANTVFKIKRSSVPDKLPLASDLEVGELAINLADRLLFSKDTSNNVFAIGGSSSAISQVFPHGDYGDLSSSSTDAFGVSTNYSFDCAVANFFNSVDLTPISSLQLN
jgi:hypothetical protein